MVSDSLEASNSKVKAQLQAASEEKAGLQKGKQKLLDKISKAAAENSGLNSEVNELKRQLHKKAESVAEDKLSESIKQKLAADFEWEKQQLEADMRDKYEKEQEEKDKLN